MASLRNGRLYVGVTSNLPLRVWQHREGYFKRWSKSNKTVLLVWYEWHGSMENAIHREKVVKKWARSWKLNLIESMNPDWKDLYCQLGSA